MKSTYAALLTAVLAGASAAQNYTFGFGHGIANYTSGRADNALWVEGEDACNYIYLGVYGESMCEFNDGWFTAPDGCEYQFTGCGTGLGNFCLSNEDGSLKSCPLVWNRNDREGDGCSNEDGSYWVDRYFIF